VEQLPQSIQAAIGKFPSLPGKKNSNKALNLEPFVLPAICVDLVATVIYTIVVQHGLGPNYRTALPEGPNVELCTIKPESICAENGRDRFRWVNDGFCRADEILILSPHGNSAIPRTSSFNHPRTACAGVELDKRRYRWAAMNVAAKGVRQAEIASGGGAAASGIGRSLRFR
jgi:hypothetical protein